MFTQKMSRWLALLLTVLLLMSVFTPSALAAHSTGKYRITSANGVNLRSGPGGSYSKVGAISYNQTVNVTKISEDDEWGYTVINGGTDGWFSLAYAEYKGTGDGGSDEPAAKTYKTTTAVNLRSGAGQSYTRITVVPEGAILSISKTEKSKEDGSLWGATSYGGADGYVAMEYVVPYSGGGNYKTGTYAIGYSTDLKKEPDATSETLINLPLNTTLEVTAVKDNWGKTTYKSYTGWFNLQNAARRSDDGDLTGDQRRDIVAVAAKEVGKTDGSKYTFGRGNVAWCAYFVSWCARQAGVPTSVIKTAGYARAYSHGVPYFKAKNYLPSPGDIAYFDWPEYDGDMNHTGIVEKVVLNEAGTAVKELHTIEGNTSNMVARRTYTTGGTGTYTKLSNVSYYGVPLYESKSAKPVNDAQVSTTDKAGQIKVSWSATSGANYYDIYLLPSGSELNLDKQVAHLRTSGTSANLSGVKSGNYEVVVYARPGDASSKAASNIVKITVDAPEPEYELTVINGSGSGSYKKGEKVSIVADKPAEGKAFIGWESSDGGSFADEEEPSTTFTMPGNNTTVEARYVKIVHVEEVKLSASKTTIDINEKITVKASFTPDDVTDERLTWSSDKSNIASVDDEGKVTGKASGKAVIKAISVENPNAYATIEITVSDVSAEPAHEPNYVTTSGLNLRAEPSSESKKLTTIPNGTKIAITEISEGWGKTTYAGYSGWVSMEYVRKIAEPTIVGTYKTTSALNLRSGASSGSTKLTTIPAGTKITITELSDEKDWGKTTYSGKTGWVSMEYVKKVDDPSEPTEPTEPREPTEPTGGETYKTTSGLNLRDGPSTDSKKLTTIPSGTKITITEIKNGWGKTTYGGKTGWVSMDYVKKDESTPTGTVYITTEGLNLRDSASASGAKLLTIPKGTKITITETKDGWGKTTYSGKNGWVSMEYVKKA